MKTFLLWGLGLYGAAMVVGGVILVTVLANLSFGVALAAGAAGVAALGVAAVRAWRDRGVVSLRHCEDCGASVGEDAGFCPRCRSVRIQEAGASDAGAARAGSAGREMPVAAYSPDGSGSIGWVDAAPPGMMGEGVSGVRALRRWGVVLLGLAGAACVWGVVGGR